MRCVPMLSKSGQFMSLGSKFALVAKSNVMSRAFEHPLLDNAEHRSTKIEYTQMKSSVLSLLAVKLRF